MTLNQLKNFVSVAEDESFSKAARRLYLSPQALIQQVHNLEDEVGFSLFSRSTQGVHLTPAGKEYFIFIKDFLSSHQLCVERAQNIAQRNTVLRIGMPGNIAPGFLLMVCQEFTARYPEIQLRYESYAWEETSAALYHNKVDICAQLDIAKNTSYHRACLFPARHFCMVSHDHPLAQKNVIHFEELSAYPIGIWGPVQTYSVLTQYARLHELVVHLKTIPQTYVDTLNFCQDGNVVITCAPLIDAMQGTLVTVPIDFDFHIHYYLAYKDADKAGVQNFLDVAQQIVHSPNHPWKKALHKLK